MDVRFDLWPAGEVRALPLDAIGERYRRYRLTSPEAEEEMVGSLRRWGQLAPITVWVREETAEVLDGFKRLSAARRTAGMTTLAARRLEMDERGAKAAIYGLNQVGRHLAELEEAWIVFALVREDGLSQVEAASLLGRHKSWVHRRLALLERLCDEAKEDLRLGLLSVTAARQFVRLPVGNQPEALGVFRREQLSMRDITVDFTRRRMERWCEGVVYNIAGEMTNLAIDVIVKAMFDVEVGEQADQLGEAVAIFSETLFREISAPFLLPDWLPLRAKRRKRWAIQTVDTLIRDIIRARRATGEDKGDLLSMLLLAVDEAGDGAGMNDEQARDEAVTMFRGGHDTTAAGLAWIWYLLACHPEVESRLLQEVDAVLESRPATYEDLPQLRYAEMVVKEALRLYPPIWALFGRETLGEVELGGFTLPRGAQLLILPWGIHRNPRFFKDAERFDPERFGPERVGELTRDAYIPFGLGPHLCIGASFATMQLVLTVATILQHFRLTLAQGQDTVIPEPHVAIRPKGGLQMIPAAR